MFVFYFTLESKCEEDAELCHTAPPSRAIFLPSFNPHRTAPEGSASLARFYILKHVLLVPRVFALRKVCGIFVQCSMRYQLGVASFHAFRDYHTKDTRVGIITNKRANASRMQNLFFIFIHRELQCTGGGEKMNEYGE